MLGETNLFDPTLLQLGIINEIDREFFPQATIQKGMPIEFIIKGAAQQYVDLNNTRLKVKFRIVKADGTAMAGGLCGPVNNILHSMWQDIQVSIRGRPVSDPSNLYPYRAYLANLLNYSQEIWDNRLMTEGWIVDTAGEKMNDPDPTAAGTNEALEQRAAMYKDSKSMTLIGRPHCDIFHQGKLLPPGVDMTIKLFPADDNFALMYKTDGVKYKIDIQECSLIMRNKQLTEALELAHRQMVQTRNFRIHYTRVQIKTLSIPKDVMTWSFENVYTGLLPDRVIVVLVKDKALAGDNTENPFYFTNYDIKRMEMRRNGISVPRLGYHPDFDKGEVMEGYLTMQEQLGFMLGDKCVSITPQDWSDGSTIFAFKVTDGPIGPGDISPRSRSAEGNLRIEIDFSKQVAESLKVVLLSEAPGIYEIDQFNNLLVL